MVILDHPQPLGGGAPSSTSRRQKLSIPLSSPFRLEDDVDQDGAMRFHLTHSENIRLSRDGTVARRTESFCKGIVFSHRPVKIGESVTLKFVELSNSWSGAIRFGFTNNDPCGLKNDLPKYACPTLTSRPGFWAKALGENLVERDGVLSFVVNQAGEVYFSIDNEMKGKFFQGVDVRKPLWALVDVYGNTVAVELIANREQLNNVRTPREESIADLTSSDVLSYSGTARSNALNLSGIEAHQHSEASEHRSSGPFVPLPFHPVHGVNIRLSNDRTVAIRDEAEYSQGYIFTSRPLTCNEWLVVKVLQNTQGFTGSLAFGLTTCDPSKLSPQDFPDDCNHLLDRMEYWVVIKEVANSPKPGDELSFSISSTGEVLFSNNGLAPVTVMHVDQTQKLWAFFDVYGITQKIKVLGVKRSTTTDVKLSKNAATGRSDEGIMSSASSSTLARPSRLHKDRSNADAAQDNADNECKVCLERPVNSVLYTCGHMCMCFECAKQLHERPTGGHCPICRAEIKDVIRTFRS